MAQSVYRLTTSQAQASNGGAVPLLKLSPVYGLNINFIQTGEAIRKVWLSDPSRVVLDTDSPLMADGSTPAAAGASVIRLRQLASPLNLGLNLPDAARNTNETLLTVITTAGSIRKLYQFRVQLGVTDSPYLAIAIVPDSMVAKPKLPVAPRQVSSTTSPILAPTDAATSTRLLQLWKGLEVAKTQNLLSSHDLELWNRFFGTAQTDADIQRAAGAIGISEAQLQQLYQWGGQP
ncbi:hypothetical protein BST81_16845 [Leptolyngbya sp. 'hensonii']|nr:hypothetical protein BST81_16845 [Leptolyngbya sp. 'hensonii']